MAELNKIGHLFQGRCRAILCGRDSLRLNPVRAAIVSEPSGYRWSSHQDYLRGKSALGIAVSLRAAGPIAIGLLFAALITPARQQSIYALGMVIMALGLIGSGLWEEYVLLTLCVVVMGAGVESWTSCIRCRQRR